MMVRLLAFALHAHEVLSFGRGVSAEEEPALWLKDLTGAVDLWIEVGQPDEKIIRRACGRAKQVCIYTYGGRGPEQWWEKNMAALARPDARPQARKNLRRIHLNTLKIFFGPSTKQMVADRSPQ